MTRVPILIDAHPYREQATDLLMSVQEHIYVGDPADMLGCRVLHDCSHGGTMTVYSHSRLGTFEQCPRQYFYKYVAKLPVPKEAQSISLYLGSRVHDCLEHLYKQVKLGIVISKPNLLRYFKRQWDEHWSDEIDLHGEGTPESWRDLGVQCIAMYYDRHQPFNETLTLELEMELRFVLDDDGRYPIIGYIDRLAKTPDGTWQIHDYKTDKRLAEQAAKDVDRIPGPARYAAFLHLRCPRSSDEGCRDRVRHRD
jgi:RecB family exonuclease